MRRGIKRLVGIPAMAIAWAVMTLILFSEGIVGADEQGRRPVGSLVGDAEAGAKLFDTSECKNCHSLNHQGSEVGPDLTQVGIRRSRDWLTEFIYEPEELFPDTKMPRFPWKTKQQVADVVAYLWTLKTPVDREGILSRAGSQAEVGKALVKAFDCRACHRIQDGGRARYPNLTHIGSKIYPEWEYHWLLDPQKIKRGTFMPTFGFTEEEAAAIAAYLEGLE